MYRAPYIEDSPEEVVRVHEAVDDVSTPNSAGPEAPNEFSQRILDAVRNQDEDAVRRLVDDGVDLSAKDTRGQTPLHLAVHNNDVSMVKFLAERGVDLEAATRNGHKALYIAAACGYLDIALFLLGFGASTESFNAEKHETAFYQAVENGHFDVAKLLLQNGADINVRSSTGLTPLFCAVSLGDAEFVEYLLEHGADKKIELEDGRTVEDFAKDDPAINILLLSDQVLQGPSIINPATRKPEHHFTFTPSLPADSIYKQYACHGFDATIMDFFLGDREQRIQVTESMYEILYGQGAEAIMEAAKGPKMRTQQPQLRWYHLPANNVRILVNTLDSHSLTVT
jgi:ankyrin repeat protein